MRIQHNIMAMNAYRNYTNNVSAMKSNLEKLSSGYKINRAGDDAAGLAISEKMRAQITGLETAQKNAKDGISLVQTAEGAMTEVHDMLNRMVELATQSANGTYDNDTDRAQMQKELDQLRSEINRIADSSNFNGIKLLDGSMDTSVKMADAKNVTVTAMADGQLGKTPQPGIYSIDLSGLDLTIRGESPTVKLEAFGQTLADDSAVDVKEGMTAEEIAQALAKAWNTDFADHWAGATGDDKFGEDFKINAEAQGDKIVFTMNKAPNKAWNVADTKGTITLSYDKTGSNNAQQVTLTQEQEAVDNTMSRMYAQGEFTLGTIKDGTTLTIGKETYVFAVGADSKYKDLDNVVDLTDLTTASEDLTRIAANRLTTVAKNNSMFKVGSANDADGTITLTEKEGGVDYAVYNLAGTDGKGSTRVGADAGASGTPGDTDADWTGLVKTGTVDSASMGKALTLQIGDTADDFNQLKVSVGDMHTAAMGIADISIADQDSAAKAVQKIKDAINYVSDVRGTLGATQNRLDHTINNLSVMTENIQDAESTIRDVDVAEEMMAYTKNNILIQSAQAMLAQANQVPQGVLQLLQ